MSELDWSLDLTSFMQGNNNSFSASPKTDETNLWIQISAKSIDFLFFFFFFARASRSKARLVSKSRTSFFYILVHNFISSSLFASEVFDSIDLTKQISLPIVSTDSVHANPVRPVTENPSFQKRSPKWTFLKTPFVVLVWKDKNGGF